MEPGVAEKSQAIVVEKPEAAMATTTTTAISTGPDWEVPDGYHSKSILPSPGTASSPSVGFGSKLASSARGFSASVQSRFGRIFPSNKTYTPLKLKRRTFLLALAGIFLALLALILGLSIGLTQQKKKSSSQNLPLPTGAEVYQGDLTYYNPGLGACGITSTDNDDIVAVAHALWDSQSVGSNPNANPLCGRMIRAQRFDSRVGHMVSVDLKVVDRCVGCQPTDLDVSPASFNKLADPDLGRVHDMTWAWI